jgi:acetate kinase
VDLAADVLVVNAGSTSLKLTLVDEGERSRPIATFDEAGAVAGVGHRIVHGGPRFREPAPVDEGVERELRELVELAPLHNGPAIAALDDARRRFPDVPHVAAFDTAFHATIPDEAATYALPRRLRESFGIRRYGFHGLSVQWASEQVRVPRLVVCHLGGGCSVTAVRDGRSVDTTMGFTPLEGVPMVTRSGSVDPGALLHLLRHGLGVDELDRALEHESGLLGLSGSDDVRELDARDDPALGVFVYRVALAVGAMATALGGLDALVFTAGIGEHSDRIRRRVCERVSFLGDFRVHVVEAREDVVVARAVRALMRAG